MNTVIATAFANYSPSVRTALLQVREWIFEVAANNHNIGQLHETLKWQVPSYLTINPQSGTTLRLHAVKGQENIFGLYVHCQTSVVSEFQSLYPQLTYEKKRAVLFVLNQPLPEQIIKHFIELALTYHLWKR
ncbi:MAG: DUF1801 domain-containing protein [Paraglaciecola sp.]|nr:DUF1801 domain-containing protein [Paraglaciecola sp.]NCT47109.1 DUF1801 domain-containing protein [Paraglaciecola sp.]